MANKYLDPLAVGTGTGDDWTNAYTGMQAVIIGCTNGDYIFCRGIEYPTTAIDAYYSNNKSALYFIGCNSSGIEDGSFFKIDLSNIVNWTASDRCILLYGLNLVRNFEITGAPAGKVALGDYGALTCINCYVHDNQGIIFSFTNMGLVLYFSTIRYNAGGISCPTTNVEYCDIRNNGTTPSAILIQGSSANGCTIISSLICNNTGKISLYDVTKILGCVFDNNVGDIISIDGGMCYLYATRITNNSRYGVYQANNTMLFEDGNFVNGNVSGAFFDDWDDCDHITEGYTKIEGNQGYVDRANGNYNLTEYATNRDIQIDIDGINKHSFCAGLIPAVDKKIFTSKSGFYKPAGIWRTKQ